MKRWMRPRIVLPVIVGLPLLMWFTSATESIYEFDVVNFRLRYCERRVSLFTEVPFWSSCSNAQEHQVARKLRELGMLEAIRDQEAKWVFMRGFRSGSWPRVRGWRGEGAYYPRGLGETTFGAAVTLPVNEDLEKNVWIQWAKRDPVQSREFWRRLVSFAQKDGSGGSVLVTCKMFLERRKGNATLAKLELEIKNEVGDGF